MTAMPVRRRLAAAQGRFDVARNGVSGAAASPGDPAAGAAGAHRVLGNGVSGARRRVGLHTLALALILALSASLNVWASSRSGYANAFYSAGVKSMLHSLHNFLYLSSDPAGLISIDKPPLAVWVQVGSAKAFGFSPLSVLLPEAIAGTLCVAILYVIVSSSFGRLAGLLAALCLAVFPSFVAVSRDNNPDALLILLMTVSCWVALRAIRSGRLLTLLGCGAIVGLAFNVKTLAAFLVVPGIALAYMVCAQGSIRARLGKLLLAGVVMAAVSLSWLTFVDLTPASQRPYVGGSLHNSELGLTFEYNGFGRIDGQSGGPGSIPDKGGAFVPLTRRAPPYPGATGQAGEPAAKRSKAPPPLPQPSVLPDGRAGHPNAFGQAPGLLRLLERGLGSQGGWLLPFALGGLLAIAMTILRRDGGRSDRDPPGQARSHGAARRSVNWRDPRLAALIVLGGWFLVEAVVLSFARGIVHPYYTSALGPGAAALAGAGAVSFADLLRGRQSRIAAAAILLLALVATVAAQIAIVDRAHYVRWLPPLLVAGVAVATIVALTMRRWTRPALVCAVALLLVAPTAFAAATSGAPIQGTFPAAGPRVAAGYGGVDLPPEKLLLTRRLFAFLKTHRGGSRFSVLTVSAVTSAPLILMGSDAASLGGYSGDDQAVGARRLAKMVSAGQARYVLLGGPYASRGGNGALRATLAACRQLPSALWGGIRNSPFSPVLFDCEGRARQIEAAGRRGLRVAHTVVAPRSHRN